MTAASWTEAASIEEARLQALATVRQRVHEGVHALRAMPDHRRPPPSKSCWPDYLYEYNDHGAYEELRWRPSPRQIDWGFQVAGWFGAWRGRDRPRNGLHAWEWKLLEVRGWQVLFGRESWADLADMLNDRPGLPTYDKSHWRRTHAWLIDLALSQAVKAGDIRL
jgi:hypothetical protein